MKALLLLLAASTSSTTVPAVPDSAAEEAAAWGQLIASTIKNSWVRPPIEEAGAAPCKVSIFVFHTGEVGHVDFPECCSTPRLESSIRDAVYKSSPLPVPNYQAFRNRLTISFIPQDGG